jgi:gag-polypeptide of LTR copia-type
MSSFPPSPVDKSTNKLVSPPGDTGTRTPGSTVGNPTFGRDDDDHEMVIQHLPASFPTTFDYDSLQVILKLVYGSSLVPDPKGWIEELDDLLGVRLGAVRYDDFSVIESVDVLAHLDPMDHSKLWAPIRTARLKAVLDYLTLVTPSLSSTLTFDSLASLAKAAVIHKTPLDQDTPLALSNKNSSDDTDTSLLKKVDIPKLTIFKGEPSDWFTWSENIRVTLGQVGVSQAISDPSFTTKYPKMSERVFYSIYAAVQQGHAGSLAKQLEMSNSRDAFQLWSLLTKEFETDTNKLNQSLYMVQKLLNLKLTKDIPVAQFRNDFRTQWLEYRNMNAKMADEKDFIRPLMLMSLQDDTYDKVREKILRDPNLTVPDFLEELRNREQIIQGVNGDTMSNIDGSPGSSVRGRRSQQAGGSKSSSAGTKQPPTGNQPLKGPWNIPLIHKSWIDMMGQGVFNFLVKWRRAAHGTNISHDQLIKQFQIVKDKSSVGNKKRDATKSTQPNPGDDNETKESAPKKVKFLLRDSRRVVTERPDTSSSSN